MNTEHVRVLPLGDHAPSVDASAWLAPDARVIGQVTVGSDSSIWYGAVVRGDREAIRIGAGSNLQDNVVVHADPGYPVTIGDAVSVGHGAVVHGCAIGEGTLVGMGAVVMNGARIGAGCTVAAGAVVLQGTEVPDGSLVAGVPGKVRRETSEDERTRHRDTARGYTDRHREHRDALG